MGLALLRAGHPFRARRWLRDALRDAPDDAELQAAFRDADLCCRLVYLPRYYFVLLMARLPGGQLTFWIAFVLLAALLPRLRFPPRAVLAFVVVYLGFYLYTWVAPLLVRPWVRVFPPR